jgi:hypothetical protein
MAQFGLFRKLLNVVIKTPPLTELPPFKVLTEFGVLTVHRQAVKVNLSESRYTPVFMQSEPVCLSQCFVCVFIFTTNNIF